MNKFKICEIYRCILLLTEVTADWFSFHILFLNQVRPAFWKNLKVSLPWKKCLIKSIHLCLKIFFPLIPERKNSHKYSQWLRSALNYRNIDFSYSDLNIWAYNMIFVLCCLKRILINMKYEQLRRAYLLLQMYGNNLIFQLIVLN